MFSNRAERGAVGRVHQQRAGGEQQRIARARAHSRTRRSRLPAGPAIARRAAVAGEALARERLVHHAEHRLAEPHQPDQRAPGQHAGDEGLGAVDRIEHPDIFGVGALGAVFLAEDAVLGKGLADQRAHGVFRRAVGGGDRIEAAAPACSRSPARCGRTAGWSRPRRVASWSTKLAKSMAVMSPAGCSALSAYRRLALRGNRRLRADCGR